MGFSPPNDADGLSRRRTLAAVAGAVGLSGCLDGEPGLGTSTTAAPGAATPAAAERPTSRPPGTTTLTGDGSSTVYPITSRAAAVWNSNPPPRDRESWGPGRYDIETDRRVADYWAGLYGFSNSDDTQPPFLVNVGLSNSKTGCTKLQEGSVDLGGSSAPVRYALPEASAADLDEFVDHVVGTDAQPIVVSREVKNAGVTRLTAAQVERIYRGEIATWSEIPSYTGPNREIQVVGRAEGSGTDAAFCANLFGDPEAETPGVDVRKGQNQQVRTLVGNADNAIAYLALAFVRPDGEVPPVALDVDDVVYEYGKNLDAKGYPLSRDLHVYTYGGTSKKEAAFLRMLLSEYGQRTFVEANGYYPLSAYRRRTELGKLPDPVRETGAESPSPAETATGTETRTAAETETAVETETAPESEGSGETTSS